MSPPRIPMVGKRYGSIVVLARMPVHYSPAGIPRSVVSVRCDCGRVYEASAQAVRDGRTKRCRSCMELRLSTQGPDTSVRLSDGRCIAGIAKASGVPLNTVYRRWLRGWPVERLGDPLRPNGNVRPLGGSRDLKSRRCTVYPDRRSA